MKQPKRKLPLQGIRILDFTQYLSGPFGSQVLADLGADVIKLEAPEGDLARHVPPHFVGDDSVYFLSVNRNKRSVVVDMKADGGRQIARRLALSCDVVIENFRPGILARLGLDAATLRAEKPSLIWCSISGFGQDGPYRDKPAYDMIVQALSGGMSITGESGGSPVRSGIPIGDLAAGLYAAIGILSALVRREASGEGEALDISMLDCQAALLCYQAAYHLFAGVVPGPQGTRHESFATYRGFECAEATQIVVTANTDRMWEGLCRVLGRAHLIDDPRFKSGGSRHENREALWQLLEEAFLVRTAEDWVPLLEAARVPAAVVNTLDRVMRDPQIVHRRMVTTIGGDAGAPVRVVGNPIVLADTPRGTDRLPPRLGADTSAVLGELLGLSASEIAALEASGAVGPTG